MSRASMPSGRYGKVVKTAMSEHPNTGLVLWADSLCSKWGFGDGDAPEAVEDWWEESGRGYADLDWHPILIRLVRSYLLTALAQHHNVQVYEISTIHNPIRAEVIDGHPVDCLAAAPPVSLAPEYVVVPWDEVFDAFRS
jgi:hypothetical protein